jgi:hypothetical protein
VKKLPFLMCGAVAFLGATETAFAKYSCNDEVVKRAMVRHVLASENIIDSNPLDPIDLTGQLFARQTKSGEFTLGGIAARKPQSWALAPSTDPMEFVVEKVGTGSLGVRILFCGYNWPGKKDEIKEKFKVENLTVATQQTTRINHDASAGMTAGIKYTPSKRTVYLVLMEPESVIRTLGYKITLK